MGTPKVPNRMRLLAQTFLLLSVTISSVHGSGSKKSPSSGCSYEQFIKNGCKEELAGNDLDGKNPTYDTCYVTECPPNVVFILDGSDSISPSNFRLAQESLAREIRAVSRTFANTNVGVVLFSDAFQDITLQPRTPAELEDVIRQVQALPQPRRRTSLTEAISRARQTIEDYSSIESRAFNGVRSGGVIVLLSDGYTNNIKETLREAQEATKEGILVVSLSVGTAPSRVLREISRVVQDQTTAINWTSLVACPGRILGSVPKGSQCRDILLTVDASDSVLQQQETVRQFLAYTALRYRLVNNAIGVNLYGTNSQVQAADTRLRLEENKYDLSERIRLRLTFPSSGGTGTDRAVLQSKTLIDEDIRGRSSAIVIIIDGPTLDQEATRNAVSQARNSGILVIIVRVGQVLTDAELSYISGGDQNLVFTVQSFTDLYGLDFDSRLCDVRSDLCSSQCPANTYRTSNCSCVCYDSSTVFDQYTRTCVPPATYCPYSCPSDSYPGANCSCICYNTSTVFDQYSRTCVCPQSCPSNAYKGSGCSCICYDSGLVFDSYTRTCVPITNCPYQCPANSYRTANCSCVCYDSSTVFDQYTRTCVLSPTVCPLSCPSNSYRGTNCSCVCYDSSLVYDQNTRTCVLPPAVCPLYCPSNSYRATNCSCVCYDASLVYDQYTRTCVLPPTVCPLSCPSNSYRGTNCSCVCYDSGLVYDQYTRICVPITNCPYTCPANSYRTANCSCVCLDSSTVFDQYTRTCVCPQSCPATAYRGTNCSCVCYDSSFVYDQYTRACVPVTTCPYQCPSNSYRLANCSCVCYDSSAAFDQYTRTCVPVTTCPYQCPSNSYRLANCSCVCYDSSTAFDQYSRTCVPVTTCPYQCPANSYRLANCSCVCYESSTVFDQYTRTCVLPPTVCPLSCPSNSYRGTNCSCVCYDSSYVYDQYTRTCVLPPTVCPLSCPSNSYRGTNCSCVCYDSGLVYDQYTMTCVPVTTCPYQCPSNSYRTANCSCLCYDSSTVFDQYSRTCVPTCPRECPFNAQRVNNCDCRCLDTSLAYNVNLNLCVSCSQSCPPNTVRNADCTCGCPAGQVYNITTRTCESSLRVCPASELRCENNQVAYKDCSGQCHCACSSEFAGTRCEIKLQPELCNDCQYVNGHYQSGVMGYCDLYVECIPVNTATNSTAWPTSFVPLIRSCAPGTYYVTRPDGTRVCDFLYNGQCSQDKCQTLPPNARYSDPSSCQSYWQCGTNGRLTSRSCCLPGQRFNTVTAQCVYDSTCQVTCGVNRTSTCNDNTGSGNNTGCPFNVNPVNPTEYFYRERPLEKFLCQPTDYMDLTVCTCVPRPTTPSPAACAPTVDMNFDQLSTNNEDTIPRIQLNQGRAGNFNGSNDLILKAFAGSGFWTDYFRINLRLFLPRPVPAGQRTAVVTNANCGTAESVSITMDDRNFYFRVVQIGTNQSAEITIPYLGSADVNGWYTVVLLYRKVNGQFQFSGTVGSTTEFYRGPVALSDYIDLRVCALHLGTGDRYSGLVAYVDDFQVWRCNPSP